MSVYKSGSTKLEPFKPGLKTKKLTIEVLTDNHNRIMTLVVIVGKQEKIVKPKEGSLKEAWDEVKNICEKALKSQKIKAK